jgi:hypothetical protein
MQWIPFVAVPVLLAIGLGAMPRVSRHAWFIVIASVVVAEIAVVRTPSTSWQLQHILAAWVLGVILPWVMSAFFLWAVHYPKHNILAAFGFAVVYFLSLTVCLAAGDAFRLIPQ